VEPKDVQHFESPDGFRAWLEKFHARRDELWVGYWKKATGRPSLTWEESVDEALCYGWIDGVRKRLDENAYTIRFTPRREGSTWSVRNMARYAELESRGRVNVPGKAAYDRRIEEKTGTYAYEQRKPSRLSDAYLSRLRSNESAWAHWQGRPPSYQKKVEHWVMSAKREDTRQRRLAKLIEDLAKGRG